MKTLKKITLLAALIASVSAANAVTRTANLTVSAYNPAQCTIGFNTPNVNIILGDGQASVTDATSNLLYSCNAGATAKIYLSSASGNTLATQFRMMNAEFPNDGGIPYSVKLGTPTGGDDAQWEFASGFTDTTNLATQVGINNMPVLQTTDVANLTGAVTSSAITIDTVGKAAPNPGQYSDTITASVVF